MDVSVVDINQNHDSFFSKSLVHPNTSAASTPHGTSSEAPTESPTVSKPKLLYDEVHDDDAVFDDDIDENHDDCDDDDDGSSSDSSKGGFVKRRIERWERLSQGDETDVTGAAIQGQASLELRQRDLPAPVVIPPTFLHGSVSALCDHSEAENELSFIRFNVIRMKADFQMTELKLKYAKWQYDVNKGTKRPVRTQKRNPALSWSSDNLSLPDIPENMAVRRRGEGAPNITNQISLASFGNDGRRRDKSGHHQIITQSMLSSPGAQNSRSTMSQSHVATPPYGSQGQMSSPAMVKQPPFTTQRLPANSHGLEAMELQLRNMNKPVEKEQPAPQRTLIAPLKPFGDNRQQSQRMSGSGGIQSHDYQRDHRHTFERSGTSNIQTSHVVPSHRTIQQKDIAARNNVDLVQSGIQSHDYQRDHRHQIVRSGSSNMQTSHAVPSPRVHENMVARTNKNSGHLGVVSHDYQRSQQHRIARSGSSNIQTPHTVPSPSTKLQDNMVTRTNNDFIQSGIQSHDYQRTERHRFERSGISNIPKSRSLPDTRTIPQDDVVMRPNEDIAHLKKERDRLLNDLSDILIEQDVAQQDEMEDEMSSGGLSEGSGYDFEDSWEMETSESPVETYDIGTQFPCPGEGGIFQEKSEFETIESRQDESKWFIEGSYQTFQSSEFTYDVCIQVSVRPTPETTPNGFPGEVHPQDNTRNKNEPLVEGIHTSTDIQCDNSELQKQKPSMTPLHETAETRNKQDSMNKDAEDLVLPLKHPNDNEQFSAVSAHLGNVLEELAQEMDNCNTPVNVEGNERTPGTLSNMDETLRNSKSDTSRVVVEEFVPHLKRSRDNVQFSASGAHHGDVLEELAQEMDNCNTPVGLEQLEQELETFSHVDETSMNDQNETSRVVVEEFVPRLKCSRDNAQLNAVGAHHEDVLKNIAHEMNNCNSPITVEQEQAPESFSQRDETSMTNQNITSKVVVEEFVPCLNRSHDKVQLGTNNTHHDDVLENLAHEMDNCNAPVSVEELEEVPENKFSHVDETSMNNQIDTSKMVVEEFVPHLKRSSDNVEFSAGGAHHDDVLEKLAQEMENGNTPVNVEQQEKPQETFNHADETLKNSPSDTSKVVVEELVPCLKCSPDNVQFSEVGADHDDVLESLAHEMENRNIPVKTDENRLNLEEDLHNPSHTCNLHISADVIKSDHKETEEQSPDKPSGLDQGHMGSQDDTNKTVVEEPVLHSNVSSHNVQHISIGSQGDDGFERLTLEMNNCNNTANVDSDGLDATDDLYVKTQTLVSEVQISEEVKHDQTDIVKETPRYPRHMHIQIDTSKEYVEEMVPRLKLSGDTARFNTNDAQRDKALEELTEEMEKGNGPIVFHELKLDSPSSDRSNVYDEERLVTDNFCEILADDSKLSVNLLKLSSSVDDGNPTQFQAKLSVGSPNVDNSQSSSSETYMCDGSSDRSQNRIGNEDELKENDGRISVDSGEPPNPPTECDSPSLPMHVDHNHVLTKDICILSQETSEEYVVPADDEDKPKTVHQKSEELTSSFDDTAEFHTAFETELAIDELAKDGPTFGEGDDATNMNSRKDTIFKDNGVMGPVSPRMSKIPVPKSKLVRSSSCPIHKRSNGKVHNKNSQIPKDHKRGTLKIESIGDKPLNVADNTTSPTFSKSFSFRHERSLWSFKGGKQQKSHIPVPNSKFNRRGSCPIRSRPAIEDLNGTSASDNSKEIANLTSHVPDSRCNIGKTRSRDIDITEALAACDKEAAGANDVVTTDEQSTCGIESRISDGSDALIPRDEKPKPVAENDVQPLSKTPFDVDEFIQHAKQILSRIPIPQTNAPETQSMPLHLTPSVGDGSQESNGITEEMPEEDNHSVPLPERDMELLSLEAEVKEDDTGSETLTLHSENDSDDILNIKSSETAEDVSEADGQRSSKSRIPVLKESRRSDHQSAPVVERRDSEDEAFDLSSRERSVARISPMPREIGDELTSTPSARKSFRSRIPLPSPIAIKPSSKINRSRSYSEADGETTMNHEEAFEEIRREEPDDTEDDVRDQHSESEQEYTGSPRRTQSSREVRPRGSYWACSTSPSLASSEFERSQTLRLNHSKNFGKRSPAVTPRTTPRGTPRSTHRNTPRSSPRDTPRGGSLRRQHPRAKTPPTFKSRECAFVPLPEWNRLREVLSSGEQSKVNSTCPSSPSEYSYTSRRSSEEFQRVHSPRWEAPVTTPKPSRWRADGRIPQHLKKKYSSMNDMGLTENLYQSDQDMGASGAAKEDIDSPWVKQPPVRASHSSQSVSLTDRHRGVQNRRANLLGERTPSNTRMRSPYPGEAASDVQPMSSTEDVSTIWTEDDTLESSNFSLPTGAKKKSWKRRFSLRRKKSVDPSKVESKESDQVKQEKKKRKNWLLRFLGIRK